MKLLDFLKQKNKKAEFNILLSRYTKPTPKTIAVSVDGIGTIHGVVQYAIVEKCLPSIYAKVCGIDVGRVLNEIATSDLSISLNVKLKDELDVVGVLKSVDDEIVDESCYGELIDIISTVTVMPAALN